jgi:trk system potassium uptake protein TrkH
LFDFRYDKANSKFINAFMELKPTQMVLLSFVVLIAAGTLLFMLPIATKDGQGLTFIDALFTSTSAACVTGLTVIDVYKQFTLFGVFVLALVIQVGGLGTMTLGAMVVLILGKKLRLRSRLVLQESLNQDMTGGVVRMTVKVLKYACAIEAVFALLFAFHFYPQFGWQALEYACFHSISAFCNAGFDLFGNYDSLVNYNGDWFLLVLTATLIFLGGLGFVVLDDFRQTKRFSRLTLQSQIVVCFSVILIIVGMVMLFVLEHGNMNTIGQLPVGDQWLNAFFTSVSTRTAGFNSFDLGKCNSLSLITMIVLMFIGASPASTGGGIKTTTTAVILLSVWAFLHGKKDVVIFNRTLSANLQTKALAVFTLAMLWVVVAFFALVAIDGNQHPVLFVLFETVSAFGTVGLSAGITPDWNAYGKLVLIATMFIGRVGILTFLLSLLEQRAESIKYPSENIMIG